MITPTVGRIVWILDRNQDGPLAAIITKVHSDTDINVCCFADTGSTQPMHHVLLVQGTSDSDINVIKPYATWMPYQKAVAKGEIPPTLHVDPKDSVRGNDLLSLQEELKKGT